MFPIPTLTLTVAPDTILKGMEALETGLENRFDALFFGFFLIVFVLILLRAAVLKFISDEISQIRGDF